MVIVKDKVTINTIPIRGQKITGIVQLFWWSSFDSYTLSPASDRSNPIIIFERIKLFFNSFRQLLRI